MNKRLPAAVAAVACAACLTFPAPASAASRSIRVHNSTKRALVYLIASDIQGSGYKIDLLGKGIVGAGRTAVVSIDDGVGECRVNLKAVLSDGAEIIRDRFDACSTQPWRIDPRRLQSRDERLRPSMAKARRPRAGPRTSRPGEPSRIQPVDFHAEAAMATHEAAPAGASSCRGSGSPTPHALGPAALHITMGEPGRWSMRLEIRPGE